MGKIGGFKFDRDIIRKTLYVVVSLLPVAFPCLLIHLVGDYPSFKALCASSGDSAFYWLQLDSLVNYGGIHGYFGFDGSIAMHGGCYSWGLAPLVPYFIFGKILGWELNSMAIANMVMISIAMFAFFLLTNSTINATLKTGIVYVLSFYTVGYSMYSTGEGERYALGILLAGIVLGVYRCNIFFGNENHNKFVFIKYTIIIFLVLFCSMAIFLPFVIALPLILAFLFKKFSVIKRTILSFFFGIPLTLASYFVISSFSAPYPYTKIRFNGVFHVLKALITNLISNLESVNFFNVIKYDSKTMFWFFIVYMAVLAVAIYNFLALPKMSTFIPVYYIAGFLLGLFLGSVILDLLWDFFQNAWCMRLYMKRKKKD